LRGEGPTHAGFPHSRRASPRSHSPSHARRPTTTSSPSCGAWRRCPTTLRASTPRRVRVRAYWRCRGARRQTVTHQQARPLYIYALLPPPPHPRTCAAGKPLTWEVLLYHWSTLEAANIILNDRCVARSARDGALCAGRVQYVTRARCLRRPVFTRPYSIAAHRPVRPSCMRAAPSRASRSSRTCAPGRRPLRATSCVTRLRTRSSWWRRSSGAPTRAPTRTLRGTTAWSTAAPRGWWAATTWPPSSRAVRV
jgi:hypothetical protein